MPEVGKAGGGCSSRPKQEAMEGRTRVVAVGVETETHRCERCWEGGNDRLWWLIGCGGEGISQLFKRKKCHLPPPAHCSSMAGVYQ